MGVVDTPGCFLQGKLQKHEAFEAEVAAHRNSIVSLNSAGDEMIKANHFASSSIKVRGKYLGA